MRSKQAVKSIHMTEDIKVVATNRKASFEYFLLEKFEAGISLQGSEIKSIRVGQVSIQEAYVDVQDGKQAWLVEAHIAPYEQANQFNHEPRRRRRLLLHKKQTPPAVEQRPHQRDDDRAHARLSQERARQSGDRPGKGQKGI